MIKIYPINTKHKPFSDRLSYEYLKKIDIQYCSQVFHADILLSSSTKSKKYILYKILFFWKKFLVWTNEPREDDTFDGFSRKNLKVMNVYSKNVFFNNLHFLGSYHYDYTNDLGLSFDKNKLEKCNHNFNKKNNCAAMYGYRNPEESKLLKDNKNISLNQFRQDLAVFLYKKGKCDIFGSGWPNDIVVKEESGFESGGLTWWDRKMEVLKDYKFNICMENTAYPYYCTEKLWHAITSGCLPIYYGANTAIYETFEEDSFIDASRFKDFEELFQFMENMSAVDYAARFNKCKEAMHKAYLEKNMKANKMEILDYVILHIKKLNN